jgi:hypothetical protein
MSHTAEDPEVSDSSDWENSAIEFDLIHAADNIRFLVERDVTVKQVKERFAERLRREYGMGPEQTLIKRIQAYVPVHEGVTVILMTTSHGQP